jgi:hypothetical protein
VPRFLRIEHSHPPSEGFLALEIVEPGVAPGDQQQDLSADSQGDGLRDAARLDAERRRRLGDRRSAAMRLDQAKLGRIPVAPLPDALEAHSPIR